jgi:tetratricopeptide (TPR) repeat protein
VKKEDYKQIIKVCEPGIEATPDALALYYYLAIAYHQAEQTDSVLSVCSRALEHVTADTQKEVISDFYSIMGDVYHTKKQMAEAYAAYDSSLVYNPSNIGALNNYAYYLSVERRDLDKAEEMSYKTVKAEPNNSTYLDTYAWILFEKGNYAEARIYIDNAMKNDGEKSDVIVEHCGDIYFMTGDVVLAGCKSSKHLATSETKTSTKAPTSSYLASRLQLTIPGKKGSMSVGGTMKMKTHERVQISLLMPILRTEVARIEVTPDEVLLVDRMNKRFVRATKAELKNVLSKNVEFSRLEKILMDASLPGGKTELTGKDIGIPSLEKAKVQLYEFSTQEFSMTPTDNGRTVLHFQLQ